MMMLKALRRNVAKFVALGALCCTLPALAVEDAPQFERRTWRDSAGKFEIRAAFVKVEQGKVTLRREDGRELNVPVEKLSEADRRYVNLHQSADPFESKAANPTRPAAADSLVLVKYERNGRCIDLLPGIVFHRAADTSYVAADISLHSIDPRGSKSPDERFTILWGPGGDHHGIAAKRVAIFRGKEKWIFAASAKELPAPLKAPQRQPKPPAAVQILGYEISNDPSFTEFQVTGTLRGRQRNSISNQEVLQLDGSWNRPLSSGLVLAEGGTPVGYFLMNQGRRSEMGRGPNSQAATPIESLATLGDPEVAQISVAPASGDEKSIQYEFAVFLVDPLAVGLAKPRLIARQVPVEELEQPGLFIRPAGSKQPISGGIEITLSRKAPSKAFLSQVVEPPNATSGATLVAQHAWPNPGLGQHVFEVQLQHVNGDGKTVDGVVHRLEYKRPPASSVAMSGPPKSPSPGRNPPQPPGVSKATDPAPSPRPEIPGLDGKPLDMPRPTNHARGGWLLTSPQTAVRPPTEKPAKNEWPKALPGNQKLIGLELKPPKRKASEPPTAPEYLTTLRFNISVIQREGVGVAPMIFSPDGAWFYVVDTYNVLHKIGTGDWQDEVKLELGQGCFDLAWSQAGLVLRLKDAAWVVAPDTLAVQRAIELGQLTRLTASPGGSLCFASNVG